MSQTDNMWLARRQIAMTACKEIPRQDLEDAVHNGILALLQCIHKETEVTNPEGFLITVANRRHWNEAAKRRPTTPLEALDRIGVQETAITTVPETPPDIFEQDEMARCLAMAIKALRSVRDRQLIELRYSQELSYGEIAAKFGVSKATMRKRMERALKALRLLLRPDVARYANTVKRVDGLLATVTERLQGQGIGSFEEVYRDVRWYPRDRADLNTGENPPIVPVFPIGAVRSEPIG